MVGQDYSGYENQKFTVINAGLYARTEANKTGGIVKVGKVETYKTNQGTTSNTPQGNSGQYLTLDGKANKPIVTPEAVIQNPEGTSQIEWTEPTDERRPPTDDNKYNLSTVGNYSYGTMVTFPEGGNQPYYTGTFSGANTTLSSQYYDSPDDTAVIRGTNVNMSSGYYIHLETRDIKYYKNSSK